MASPFNNRGKGTNMNLQSRLQSRLSKRRNFIRFVESDLAEQKDARQRARQMAGAFHVEVDLTEANEVIAETRKLVKGLADDQRLDKQLKNLVVLTNQSRRYYGLSDF